MSKQMTIKMMGKTVEVKTNSEVAIKRALCKVMRMNNLTFGNILTVKIVDDQVQFTYQSKKATWNTWVPTCNSIAEIVAEVEAPVVAEVEVEAPAVAEVSPTEQIISSYTWFQKELNGKRYTYFGNALTGEGNWHIEDVA